MMLLDIVKKGSTDRSVTIRIIDSATGLPETGVEHNSAGIDLWYRREGAAKTSITEAALSALTDAHSDGGIEHVGDGYYRLDLPDAAFATGANYVDVGGTVTDMIVIGGRVRLVNYDPEDTVRLGLTALPSAAAEAAGGLYTRGTGAGQINQAANGMIDTNPVRLNNVAQSLLDLKDFADDGYDPSTNKVQGVVLVDTLTTYTGNTPQTGDSYAIVNGASGLVAIKGDTADILADTADMQPKLGTPNEIADAVLLRNVSNVEATAGEHTLCTVVLAMLEHSISGTILTIKRTDGTTTHATKTLTTDVAAEPITGID